MDCLKCVQAYVKQPKYFSYTDDCVNISIQFLCLRLYIVSIFAKVLRTICKIAAFCMVAGTVTSRTKRNHRSRRRHNIKYCARSNSLCSAFIVATPRIECFLLQSGNSLEEVFYHYMYDGELNDECS